MFDDCGELGTHLLHHGHRAPQALERIAAGVRAIRGCTPRQPSVLVAATNRPGIGRTALTAIAAVDRTSLGDNLKRLRSKGPMTRTRSKAHLRERLVNLIDDGMRAVSAGRFDPDLVDERVAAALEAALATGLRDAVARFSILS